MHEYDVYNEIWHAFLDTIFLIDEIIGHRSKMPLVTNWILLPLEGEINLLTWRDKKCDENRELQRGMKLKKEKKTQEVSALT